MVAYPSGMRHDVGDEFLFKVLAERAGARAERAGVTVRHHDDHGLRLFFGDEVVENESSAAHGAPGIIRIKRAVQTGSEIPFESALALERELQQQLFQSEDAKEGLDAYVNKRKPEFKGK